MSFDPPGSTPARSFDWWIARPRPTMRCLRASTERVERHAQGDGERARGGGRGRLHRDGTGGGPRRQPGGGLARPGPGHGLHPRRRRDASRWPTSTDGSFTPWRSLGGYLDSGPGAAGRSRDDHRLLRPRGRRLALPELVRHRRAAGPAGSGSGTRCCPRRRSRSAAAAGSSTSSGAASTTASRPSRGCPGSGWTDVNNTQLDPGLTASAPAAVSRNNGMVDVIVRGTNDRVYINAYNGVGAGAAGRRSPAA